MRNKVKRIGTVTLKHPLWVKEQQAPADVQASMRMSDAGSHIVYETQITTPYITLESREWQWIEQAEAEALTAMFSDLSVSQVEIEYQDGTTQNVRFAREKGVAFTPAWPGACWYSATINLAKV